MSLAKTLIIWAIVLLPVGVWAATHVATSSSFADVNSALVASSDGDIVSIPAGAATWSSTLTITKAITIQGAGSSSTIITADSSSRSLIVLSPGSDKAQRITGIGFIGGQYKIQINGATNGSYVLDNFRIDHCDFENDTEAIFANGWLEGLIDHNTFKDCNRTILIKGDDNRAWSRMIAAGTAHALFIEDNYFQYTNAHVGLDQWIYHQEGARTVVRHNTFDGTLQTGADTACFDSHNNQNYYVGGTDFRGQPILEVYNNTFAVHHTYQMVLIRGGSVLFHDNAFTYIDHCDAVFVLGEEEAWQTAFFSPLRTEWPAQDQLNNSFFWNNTLNGVPITSVSLWVPIPTATFIQENRDYWMAAPAASGGYEYYTGARQGGSTTAPTTSDTGSMAFSASGANAYYPYTPYTYPHPLQAGLENTPNAPPPTGLRVK